MFIITRNNYKKYAKNICAEVKKVLFKFKKSKKHQEKVRKNIRKMSEEIAKIWSGENEKIKTDINGSYTGQAEDNSPPTQDADDL
jgi:DNA anti-recombination protein RmuC